MLLGPTVALAFQQVALGPNVALAFQPVALGQTVALAFQPVRGRVAGTERTKHGTRLIAWKRESGFPPLDGHPQLRLKGRATMGRSAQLRLKGRATMGRSAQLRLKGRATMGRPISAQISTSLSRPSTPNRSRSCSA